MPSQIYVVGYSLLLLIVALALVMMPRAMALSPSDFGALSEAQRFERAAGLEPLGASGIPELRIWSTAGAEPGKVSAIVVTPGAITHYDLVETTWWGRQYDVARRDRDATPTAAQALRLSRQLAANDSRYLVCGSDAVSVSVSGYVDGQEFRFSETGDCSGDHLPALDELFRLTAVKR